MIIFFVTSWIVAWQINSIVYWMTHLISILLICKLWNWKCSIMDWQRCLKLLVKRCTWKLRCLIISFEGFIFLWGRFPVRVWGVIYSISKWIAGMMHFICCPITAVKSAVLKSFNHCKSEFPLGFLLIACCNFPQIILFNNFIALLLSHFSQLLMGNVLVKDYIIGGCLSNISEYYIWTWRKFRDERSAMFKNIKLHQCYLAKWFITKYNPCLEIPLSVETLF